MSRRKAVAMILLLAVVSIAASVFVPGGHIKGTSIDTTRISTDGQGAVNRGDGMGTIKISIDVDRVDPKGLATFHVKQGERVQISVYGNDPNQVEVSGYDLIEPFSSRSTASFDFIANIPGTHNIDLLESNDVIGVISVQNPG